MSQQSIVDLFYAANKLHAQFEQKYGRRMVSPEHENTSKIIEFADGYGRHVSALLEFRGDRHALTLLAEMVQKIEGVPPHTILFIIDGYGRHGVEQHRYSPQYLAEEIAQRFKLTVANGIKTVADWDVIAEVIDNCAALHPAIPRKKVVGSLLLSEALKNWRKSKNNILEAIETLASCWNTPEQRVVGISELYSAVEKMSQIDAAKKKQINSLLALTAKRNAGRLDLENWLVVSDLIDEAGKRSISRELILGSVINTMAPIDESGFPDFIYVMNTAQQTWGEGVGREELHKCLVAAQTELRKSPDSFKAGTQRIGQILAAAQNNLTADSIRRVLDGNNRCRLVLVVAGLAHEKGIRDGFDR